jgi:hypothetical protein
VQAGTPEIKTAPPDTPPPSTTSAATDALEHRGRRSPILVATGLVAFLAGAGVVGLLWALSPPAPPPNVELGHVALPSPYEALNSLADKSPSGTKVEADQGAQFLERGRKAGDGREMSFWKKWAMRSMLRSNRSGAAATLSEFANDLASSHRPSDYSASAAARFVWEMAAVGCDCTAMEHIAKSLEESGGPDNLSLAQTWRSRSQQCRLEKGDAERACPKP